MGLGLELRVRVVVRVEVGGRCGGPIRNPILHTNNQHNFEGGVTVRVRDRERGEGWSCVGLGVD